MLPTNVLPLTLPIAARARRTLGALVLLVTALACAPALAQQPNTRNLSPGFAGLAANDKVVLMPVDVELFELGVGTVEPKADWTDSAQRHMAAAIAERKAAWKLNAVPITTQQVDDAAELVALQAAVARSISLHHGAGGSGPWALPTKDGKLVWSFGDAMKPLADATGARYALFVWMRDRYASAGRKAAMVVLALAGIGLSGGVQVGYATLVDLHSGDVVWFNQNVSGFGDLREAEPARASVTSLLTGFPAGR
jgi:hypothetical protein